MIYKLFAKTIQSDQIKCSRVKQILTRMCLLFGLCELNKDCRACYESGYIQAKNFSELVLEAIKQVNSQIRPDALNLIESSDISDEVLNSAVGNYYGDIYERHLELAKNSRMNTTKDGDAITDGFREYMIPVLKGKL